VPENFFDISAICIAEQGHYQIRAIEESPVPSGKECELD
jgi:hypothetical protein